MCGRFAVTLPPDAMAQLFAAQSNIKDAGLGYAAWAILIGLLISNTIGTPVWGKPAVQAMEAAHAAGAPVDLTPKDGDAAGLAAATGGAASRSGPRASTSSPPRPAASGP